MSNYKCAECGADIIDSPAGYITGCEHWPIENNSTETEKEKNKSEGVKDYDESKL